MIHYHGTPITPNSAAIAALAGRHGMVSFANQDQIALVAEVCQSFALDNGAFSLWGKGETVDSAAYGDWVSLWSKHPGFDWCIIPDRIDGSASENLALIDSWPLDRRHSVPVWHLHEPLEQLRDLSFSFYRVAFGSSGEWSEPGTDQWWDRMNEAMDVVCDGDRPRCKLHGLRMLDPTIFSAIPLSSADSCNVARNIGIDSRWDKGYLAGMSKSVRAHVLANRIESHAAASSWARRSQQQNFALLG